MILSYQTGNWVLKNEIFKSFMKQNKLKFIENKKTSKPTTHISELMGKQVHWSLELDKIINYQQSKKLASSSSSFLPWTRKHKTRIEWSFGQIKEHHGQHT